jgi:hypothetical protein
MLSYPPNYSQTFLYFHFLATAVSNGLPLPHFPAGEEQADPAWPDSNSAGELAPKVLSRLNKPGRLMKFCHSKIKAT